MIEMPAVEAQHEALVPDWECPNCSRDWYRNMDDRSSDPYWDSSDEVALRDPWSASQKYCVGCVADEMRTNHELLLGWYNDCIAPEELLQWVLELPEEPSGNGPASGHVEMIRESLPDLFMDWLTGYAEEHRTEYEAYLMETA